MQLTLFSDYALRTLLYLGAHPGQLVPAAQISDAFGVSADHVAKAAKWLTQQGYVRAQRGKAGGLMLSRKPARIRGWCAAHHSRYLRHGDPLGGHHPTVGCSVADCERPHHGLGLCAPHYQQKLRADRRADREEAA